MSATVRFIWIGFAEILAPATETNLFRCTEQIFSCRHFCDKTTKYRSCRNEKGKSFLAVRWKQLYSTSLDCFADCWTVTVEPTLSDYSPLLSTLTVPSVHILPNVHFVSAISASSMNYIPRQDGCFQICKSYLLYINCICITRHFTIDFYYLGNQLEGKWPHISQWDNQISLIYPLIF